MKKGNIGIGVIQLAVEFGIGVFFDFNFDFVCKKNRSEKHQGQHYG
jgi:hypothetical protein